MSRQQERQATSASVRTSPISAYGHSAFFRRLPLLDVIPVKGTWLLPNKEHTWRELVVTAIDNL
jgi:hypothetical protein